MCAMTTEMTKELDDRAKTRVGQFIEEAVRR